MSWTKVVTIGATGYMPYLIKAFVWPDKQRFARRKFQTDMQTAVGLLENSKSVMEVAEQDAGLQLQVS